MLYRHGGIHDVHGSKFSYIIADADDSVCMKKLLGDGWHFTTSDALKYAEGKLEPSEPVQKPAVKKALPVVEVDENSRIPSIKAPQNRL